MESSDWVPLCLVTDDYIVIKFDEHGEKKFISSMVLPSLKKSDRQPPVEKRATRASKKAAPAATTNSVQS